MLPIYGEFPVILNKSMDTTERKFLASQTLYSLVIAKCHNAKRTNDTVGVDPGDVRTAFEVADAIIKFDKENPLNLK